MTDMEECLKRYKRLAELLEKDRANMQNCLGGEIYSRYYETVSSELNELNKETELLRLMNE